MSQDLTQLKSTCTLILDPVGFKTETSTFCCLTATQSMAFCHSSLGRMGHTIRKSVLASQNLSLQVKPLTISSCIAKTSILIFFSSLQSCLATIYEFLFSNMGLIPLSSSISSSTLFFSSLHCCIFSTSLKTQLHTAASLEPSSNPPALNNFLSA